MSEGWLEKDKAQGPVHVSKSPNCTNLINKKNSINKEENSQMKTNLIFIYTINHNFIIN